MTDEEIKTEERRHEADKRKYKGVESVNWRCCEYYGFWIWDLEKISPTEK